MLSKVCRAGSIFFRSTPKFSHLSPKVFSASPVISSSQLNFSKSFSSAFSTVNLQKRLYSNGGSVSKEMESFLTEEIKAEKASSKPVNSIPGFEIKADGSNVELTRKFSNESIRIRLNINGSTADDEINDLPESENTAPGPLLSKPSFSIEVTKPSGKTLCLSCNFAGGTNQFEEDNQENSQQNSDDIFEIEAITVLDKPNEEMEDNVYMGDASLIDGQLYDILMDYLDERGIGKEFASHLIDYCTSYEHERYIKLLEDLKAFVK